MSQKQEILNHLRTIGPITPLQALHRYRVMRLAPRIKEIRNSGYLVLTNMKRRTDKRTGRVKRYAEYSLSTDHGDQ